MVCETRKSSTIRTQEKKFRVHLAIVVFRHGARTDSLPPFMPQPGTAAWDALWGQCRNRPKMPVPADFFDQNGLTSGQPANFYDGEYRPCLPGDLTKKGESQLRDLGGFLRRRYAVDGFRLL